MQVLKRLPHHGLILFSVTFLLACGSGSNGDGSDMTAPIITLNGPSTVHLIQGKVYTEAGATAFDDIDGNLTSQITIGGDAVDTNSPFGTPFNITYNVVDAAGNKAIEVIRKVLIIKASNLQHTIPTLSEADKANYLSLINDTRAVSRTCGAEGYFPAVTAVTWSNKLYKSAYEHSQDLANSDTWSHDGSGTSSDWSGYALNKKSKMRDRVATYDYQWTSISENISAGTQRDTAQEAIDSWIASPGHCKNLMDTNMTQVGMALFKNTNSTYTHYWTQNFGKPQ